MEYVIGKSSEQYVAEELHREDGDVVLALWREVALESGDASDYIYERLEDMDDLFAKPIDMARAVFFGELDNWYDKCHFNVYGNIQSVHNIFDVVDMDRLVDFLIENKRVEFTLYYQGEDLAWSDSIEDLIGDYELFETQAREYQTAWGFDEVPTLDTIEIGVQYRDENGDIL